MWFRSLIDSQSRSSLVPNPKSRPAKRSRYLGQRINLEPLEDRRMLSFTPAVDYAAAGSAIVSADFNSDGRIDLATAGQAGGVSVLLGNSNGTFQAAQPSPSGNGPLSIAVGDFNSDGKLDLVTGNAGDGDISLLLGNGNGTFKAPTSILGDAPSSVAVGDLNSDGKLDLGVTSNFYYPGGSGYYGSYPGWYRSKAYVLLGNGGGSFSTPMTALSDFGYLTAATLADFNGDGKLDFAVANRDSSSSVVLPGTGTGTFGTPTYVSSLYLVSSMVAGDVNGDGKLDLVAASEYANFNVGVLLGTGTGSFQATQPYTSGGYPQSVALGDLNGDGKLDIVSPSSSDNTLGVMLGDGATFRPPVAVPTGLSPGGLVIGDFNGDGRPDAATAHSSGNVSVLLNDGIWPATDLPSLTIANLPPIVEGNVGTVQAVFTVSLSSAYSQPITIAYTTADGGATAAGGDYQAKSGTLTFTPGQTAQAITVLVNGDRVVESSETFSVKLTNPTNAFLADAVGVETIQDDEPYLSISSASGFEGNTGTTPFLFTVTLSTPSDAPVKVGFATSNLPYEWNAFSEAIADVDYQATSGTLTFAPGETSKPITVLVNGDRSPAEYDEYFFVNLSSPEGAGIIGGGQTYGGIQDDEPLVGFGYASVTEGNSGTTPLVFTGMLSAAYDAPVTVGYTTYDGSATAGIDYTATSGTLTFAPGETSKTVTVMVNGDTVYEGDDYFNLSIVESNSATFDYNYGYAVGTIVDDDPNTPQISISDVTKKEGNAGKTAFVFTVDLSAAPSSRVTVNYATANGSAAANSDFQAASGTITFAPGQTSKTVTVQVKGDTTAESDEYFELNLSGAEGATIVDPQGIGTIIDDDVPKIRISDVSKKEGNSGTTSFVFTVRLSAASTSQVTVNYATANGTAESNDGDYDAKSGKLTFKPGQTSKTITIPVHGDRKKEAHETFFINLANANGASLDDDTGVGTILDDDRSGRRSNWIAFASSLEDAMEDFLNIGNRKRGR